MTKTTIITKKNVELIIAPNNSIMAYIPIRNNKTVTKKANIALPPVSCHNLCKLIIAFYIKSVNFSNITFNKYNFKIIL